MIGWKLPSEPSGGLDPKDKGGITIIIGSVKGCSLPHNPRRAATFVAQAAVIAER